MRVFTVLTLSTIIFAFLGVMIEQRDASSAKGKSEPKWKSLSEGLATAKSQNRKIMMDVYTDWCGWCKKLDAEVYSNDKVKDYLDKHFVSVKLNAESARKHTFNGSEHSEAEIAQMFGVTGYPSIVFMQPDGKTLAMLPGFVPAETFITVLTYISEESYKRMKWSEYLEKHKTN